MREPCPCQSGLSYVECCEPLHLKKCYADTALQLMRSRYCAFVKGNVDYIIETTLPNQQKLLSKQALIDWAKSVQWQGLTILEFKEKLTKNKSKVHFEALFKNEEGDQVHNEMSLFVSLAGRWYFVDPTVELPSQKSSCVCGSKKKFKHCCGGYLWQFYNSN